MDDTFVVQQKSHKVEFFHHINTVDTSIQFTVEEVGPDGSIPFLDILVTPSQMEPLSPRYIESPPILINISSGIVTIALHQNIV